MAKKIIISILLIFAFIGCEPDISDLLESPDIPPICKYMLVQCISKNAEGCSVSYDACKKATNMKDCEIYAKEPVYDHKDNIVIDFQSCWDKRQ